MIALESESQGSDVETEEVIFQCLEEEEKLSPRELRLKALEAGVEKKEYRNAYNRLMREERLILGVDGIHQEESENFPYVRLPEKY